MNAIIFATVGTSALTNQEIGDVVVREKGAQLRSDVRTYLRAAPELRERRAAKLGLERRLTEAHEAYFRQDFSVCLEPRNYPMSAAELTSMPALLEAIRERGEQMQRLVLLASDTPEGEAGGPRGAMRAAHSGVLPVGCSGRGGGDTRTERDV